jgi:hypothetical protein
MRSMLVMSVALAACATTNSGAPVTPASETVRVFSPSGTASMRMSSDDAASTRKVTMAADQVWRLLPSVFDSLGIPVTSADPAKRTIGNDGFNVRGRLKGVPLSRYIDCGGSTGIGPNADSYQVNLLFLVGVRPADGGSSVSTTLQAMAKPVNFAQDYSACSSKGTLETRLVELLSARARP